jgi:hypothetical protein
LIEIELARVWLQINVNGAGYRSLTTACWALIFLAIFIPYLLVDL